MPAFQPYRGKPAVRNDREGRGNVGIIRSPVRASTLPDCGGRAMKRTSLPLHCPPAFGPLEDEKGKSLADLSLLAEPTRLAIVPWLLVFFIVGASSSGSLAARRRHAAGLQRIGPLHSTRQISSWQKPTMHPAFKPASSSAGGQS